METIDNKKPPPVLNLDDFTNTPASEISHQFESSHHNTHAQATINELANDCLINYNERLEPPHVAMQIMTNNEKVTLFTKGNFSVITGAAKSRKSFLVSMLMATAMKGNVQDMFYSEPSKGINILFDTEQAKQKVQQIQHRITKLAEQVRPDNLLVYTLRTKEPKERIEIIDHVLSTTPDINFVAIDGIIDLDIDPILQAEQAQNIITKLMQWTEIYNIHITCVLHYNKNVSTLLGHLGSFAHRKADAVIEVAKSKQDNSVSEVKAIDTREKEFLPFAFGIDGFGMPYILQDYEIETKSKTAKEPKEKKPVFSFKMITREEIEKIIQDVFKIEKQQGYSSCWRNIKNAVVINTSYEIGDNKAKDLLADFLREEKIIKKDVGGKNDVYVLPGQSKIDFNG